MARVHLTDEAKEDVRDLDGSARKLVLKAMVKLRDEPEKRGAPLGSRTGGNLTTFRKLVVGNRDYRIIYRVEQDGRVAVVWVVKDRADDGCYDIAVARLRLHGDRELADVAESLLGATWRPNRSPNPEGPATPA